MPDGQKGFTLVELMVAMAIGAVIILGAGKLFLTSFQTFQTVDKVSRKQETLIFAVSTLTAAGRKGNIADYAIVSDGRHSDSGTDYYCVLQDEVKNQPVLDLAQVDDEADCPTLSKTNSDDVSHLITLPLGDCRESVNMTCDEITFTISERNKAISSREPTS
ncbi:prepilin-type N-terminal cleavage/methylation domain-containing protein [Halomonas sp. SpR1]|uniref:PilW family protein n=1 Tax=Halomonas sp. SpR1 TaxID=3050462 RepID=UPI0027E49627|nr:prepilin-type N-terminal cleavage/methylation domain-containing protein [Halomonas sp. SpR1]MDQ7735361.1 prepilin-type N-terminal cleavage/methylation domain-containing protein [Halomonas sp. SpR1]